MTNWCFWIGDFFLGLGIEDLNPQSLILKTTIPNSKSPIGNFITIWWSSLLFLYYIQRANNLAIYHTRCSQSWSTNRCVINCQTPDLPGSPSLSNYLKKLGEALYSGRWLVVGWLLQCWADTNVNLAFEDAQSILTP